MKFKVGDKVRITDGVHYVKSDYKGCVGVIKGFGKRNFTHDDAYDIDFPGCPGASKYWWIDEELELVVPEEFTKSDLKDGMVVEYRHGGRALYIGDRFVGECGGMPLGSYNDNLTRNGIPMLTTNDGKPSYDIMKVYKTTACSIRRLFNDDYLELIWERKEEPKPTHKYKAGDKVKVRSDLEHLKRYGGIGVIEAMTPLKGKTVTIKNTAITSLGYHIYNIEESYWHWTDEMFEGLVDYEEMTVAEIEEKLGHKVKIVGED